MTDPSQERLLADLLEDFHRRRALGERPTIEEYREAAGDSFARLQQMLEAEAALDRALESAVVTTFPMPFGDYTLLRELGRGAVGVVYEALHRRLGRKVAVKILKAGFDTHPTAIERFRREARACAQVRHDHIVQVYEAGECDGRHYYAMALLEGRSLTDALRERTVPEPRDFARAMAGVADALHTLHERGIVHRDIKPSNIMIEPTGRMILADFGLARTVASESLTLTGEAVGTPLYMSPEQLLGAGSEIDGRTDVYGLGATMYEALAGHPAFRAPDMASLMRMILRDRPQRLRQAAPKVPEELDRIVMKAMEKQNADRYGSAAALRDDLRAFAEGAEVRGRPVSNLRHTLRGLRRQARWLLPTAALVVAGLVVLAIQPPAPATVLLGSLPPAQVVVNDTPRGETPLRLDLQPGEYRILFRREGWAERSRELRLDAGQRHDVEVTLLPLEDVDAEQALGELAKGFDLQMEKWEDMLRERGAPLAETISILLPRGDVRREDLTEYHIRLSPEFEATGAVVFEVRGREVYRRAVDDTWPENLDVREPVPAAVLEAARKGLRVTWGFHPEKGRPVTASFTVVEVDLDRRLASIERRLKEHDPLLRDQLVAQLYLDRGLTTAAYGLARSVTERSPDAPAAYAIMKAALTKMKLKDSPLWHELAGASAVGLRGRRAPPLPPR